VDRPEIWIALRPEADVLREAALLDERSAAGERLPLAGRLLAVKDNIDVVGLPTTAGCPAYSYLPTQSAPAVSAATTDSGVAALISAARRGGHIASCGVCRMLI